MKCENCNQDHDGSYGSGRFCSRSCANTRKHNKKTKDKIAMALQTDKPICKNCGKILGNRKRSTGLCKSCLYKSLEYKNKISNSMKGKGGGLRKGAGIGKSGWYKGYWCDSSWELAFVIYNLDHDVKFERNKKGFEYEFEGKTLKYYPDFIMEDGSYIEVKGYMDKKNKAKHQQFDGVLNILKKNEIQSYLDYVKNKYGNNFIELFEYGFDPRRD